MDLFEVDGCRLRVTTGGQGSTVLLIHGTAASLGRGGWVSLDLAATRPELAAGLVIIEAPLFAVRWPRLDAAIGLVRAKLADRRGDPRAGATHTLHWARGRPLERFNPPADAQDKRDDVQVSAAAEPSEPLMPLCWCCGNQFDEVELVRLGDHPEVGVCAGCARFLQRRATQRQDELRPTPVSRLRGVVRAGRGLVLDHGWQDHRVFGRWLRKIDRLLP